VDEARNKELENLLQRLGRLIHAAVVDSEEVHAGLAELRAAGWDAVMLLEVSMLCRSDGGGEPPVDPPEIQVAKTRPEAEYQLDSADARWLSALGISPTRHRSIPRRALPPLSPPSPRSRDDG
jgi:hypothetical protein